MREYSEEFLGNPEHDGSAAQMIEYDSVEPFRSLNAARRAGSYESRASASVLIR
jgi:hypothetical protein